MLTVLQEIVDQVNLLVSQCVPSQSMCPLSDKKELAFQQNNEHQYTTATSTLKLTCILIL